MESVDSTVAPRWGSNCVCMFGINAGLYKGKAPLPKHDECLAVDILADNTKKRETACSPVSQRCVHRALRREIKGWKKDAIRNHKG